MEIGARGKKPLSRSCVCFVKGIKKNKYPGAQKLCRLIQKQLLIVFFYSLFFCCFFLITCEVDPLNLRIKNKIKLVDGEIRHCKINLGILGAVFFFFFFQICNDHIHYVLPVL